MASFSRLWFAAFGLLLQSHLSYTQQEAPEDWFLRDPELDRVQGMSVNRVYETLLKGQPSRTIVVAVIDSGIDTDHEDLKGAIWVNEDEVAGNGVDDDKNGYVDDIHGWNFIGGKKGNVNEDTYELTREYVRLKEKFEKVEDGKVPKRLRDEYEQFLKIQDKYQKLKTKNEQQYQTYKSFYTNISSAVDTLKSTLGSDTLTVEQIMGFNPSEPALIFAKGIILTMMKNFGDDATIEELVAQLKEGYDYFKVIVEFGYNEAFDSRLIVGDDYNNLYEREYGNNDVKGPDAKHGTHVAGIIAADRKNDIGVKGIADNVRIMVLRVVPNGDERDKDVANGIIYAVDNGAHIINMSFGKSFSPQKEAVDRAVKYAEQKGVLLVHAAGNDAKDIDQAENYPTRFYLDGKEARNWLEIGASSWGADDDFVGGFSNYGKKSVDMFAPGVQMYSTTPEDKYEELEGTSFASPAVAGVAAMLMSYFPELTALEVKDILKKSSRKFEGLEIQRPGSKSKARFSDLSSSGGVANAFEAVKMAQGVKNLKLVK